MSIPTITSLLKCYLKPFIFRVHPDFFGNNQVAKSTNASSLQNLYSVINPLLGKHSAKISERNITLHFFPKASQTAVTHVITILPGDISAWEVTLSFMELCRKVGVKVNTEDIATVQNQINRLQFSSQKSQKTLTQIFAEGFHASSTQSFAYTPKLCGRSKDEFAWTNKLLFFQPGLTAQHVNIALRNLNKWICVEAMRGSEWWGKVPVIIVIGTDEGSMNRHLGHERGFLVIPWNITKDGLESYLTGYLDSVRNRFWALEIDKFRQKKPTD